MSGFDSEFSDVRGGQQTVDTVKEKQITIDLGPVTDTAEIYYMDAELEEFLINETPVSE